nr:MAG TPA_asm: hypothetical protein [Caudoviricetes sp.]
MEWIEPKTDWKVEYDENGNYIGDYVNAEDINRMINNLKNIAAQIRQILFSNHVFEVEYLPDVIRGDMLDRVYFKSLQDTIGSMLVYIYDIEATKLFNQYIASTMDNTVMLPTWEWYNAVERITKMLDNDIKRIQNDKRKLKYRLGIPNTGGF